jgi:hypothetical protein
VLAVLVVRGIAQIVRVSRTTWRNLDFSIDGVVSPWYHAALFKK